MNLIISCVTNPMDTRNIRLTFNYIYVTMSNIYSLQLQKINLNSGNTLTLFKKKTLCDKL
jgi:hypothetical protein